jgi:hypothetical protein
LRRDRRLDPVPVRRPVPVPVRRPVPVPLPVLVHRLVLVLVLLLAAVVRRLLLLLRLTAVSWDRLRLAVLVLKRP